MVLKNINQLLGEDTAAANDANTVLEQSLVQAPSTESNILETASGESEEDDEVSGNKACKPFQESEMERFWRINKYFNDDSPSVKIHPSELGKLEALKWYGIIMQGSYGDNKDEAPSWFDLVERLKWNAYEGVKGMDKHEARVTFLEGAHNMLAERGFSDEHPQKA